MTIRKDYIMTNKLIIKHVGLAAIAIILLSNMASAQHKSFIISQKGDTINIVDNKGLKQGKWVTTVGEVRGEPGFDEEGYYKDDKKTGTWRQYNSTGDLIGLENYLNGGKAGAQDYFTFLGDLIRHEEWRGYNPDAPYDTVAIYGEGNNEIIDYKLVKAQQYSVKHGEWRYYEPGGRMIKTEYYDRGSLQKSPNSETAAVTTAPENPKEKVKTKEILEYEKKYSKKKRAQMERDGRTGL